MISTNGTNSLDCQIFSARLHSFNTSPARVQIAHDGAAELLRNDKLQGHYGFQHDRAGFEHGFFHSHEACALERCIIRVALVVTAVAQGDLRVNNLVARDGPRLQRISNPSSNWIEESLWEWPQVASHLGICILCWGWVRCGSQRERSGRAHLIE